VGVEVCAFVIKSLIFFIFYFFAHQGGVAAEIALPNTTRSTESSLAFYSARIYPIGAQVLPNDLM
jgi:hypothetical protein